MQGDTRTDGRDESPEERADRKWADLLQEIRVAQTGVQILFGFLLTVVFQPSYRRLSEADQTLYMVTIVLGAAAIGALVAPVAFHRIVTGRFIKPEAVVWASRLTLLGLLLLLLTMISSSCWCCAPPPTTTRTCPGSSRVWPGCTSCGGSSSRRLFACAWRTARSAPATRTAGSGLNRPPGTCLGWDGLRGRPTRRPPGRALSGSAWGRLAVSGCGWRWW